MATICCTFLVKKSSIPKNQQQHACRIYYTAVSDYLKRQEKLDYLKNNQSIASPKLVWQALTPDAHGDWLNQHSSGEYDQYPRMGDKKDKTGEADKVFCDSYSLGLATHRDAWCYNYSSKHIVGNIKTHIDTYNSQRERIAAGLLKRHEYDTTKISWCRSLENYLYKNKVIAISDGTFCDSSYRPFVKMRCYYSKDLNDMIYQLPKLFPFSLMRQQQNDSKEINRVISVAGPGGKKDFSCLMVNHLPCLDMVEKGQCFPLYVYEAGGARQQELFGGGQGQSSWTRRSGITGWSLDRARKQYGRHEITEEDIFYYVYGMLHCPQYRDKYQNDFKKALPRVPFVEKYADFVALRDAGRALGDLHCDYEHCPMNTTAQIVEDGTANYLIDKLRPVGKGHFTELKYNSHITITNIPPEAHEYIVNGRSPLGWIIDQYQVSVDKDSGIKNDPNDWCREHNNPRYILELILRVIEVSVRTVRIVKGLPNIE